MGLFQGVGGTRATLSSFHALRIMSTVDGKWLEGPWGSGWYSDVRCHDRTHRMTRMRGADH